MFVNVVNSESTTVLIYIALYTISQVPMPEIALFLSANNDELMAQKVITVVLDK